MHYYIYLELIRSPYLVTFFHFVMNLYSENGEKNFFSPQVNKITSFSSLGIHFESYFTLRQQE